MGRGGTGMSDTESRKDDFATNGVQTIVVWILTTLVACSLMINDWIPIWARMFGSIGMIVMFVMYLRELYQAIRLFWSQRNVPEATAWHWIVPLVQDGERKLYLFASWCLVTIVIGTISHYLGM